MLERRILELKRERNAERQMWSDERAELEGKLKRVKQQLALQQFSTNLKLKNFDHADISELGLLEQKYLKEKSERQSMGEVTSKLNRQKQGLLEQRAELQKKVNELTAENQMLRDRLRAFDASVSSPSNAFTSPTNKRTTSRDAPCLSPTADKPTQFSSSRKPHRRSSSKRDTETPAPSAQILPNPTLPKNRSISLIDLLPLPADDQSTLTTPPALRHPTRNRATLANLSPPVTTTLQPSGNLTCPPSPTALSPTLLAVSLILSESRESLTKVHSEGAVVEVLGADLLPVGRASN